MDFHVQGSRPSSGRPESRINPITGEQINYSTRGRANDQPDVRHTKPHTKYDPRPQGVPKLSLGKLANEDDDPDLTLHMDPYTYKLDSPGSASTISWGTPTSATALKHKRQLEKLQGLSSQDSYRSDGGDNSQQQSARGKPVSKPKQPTAWDRDPVPENLPPPSQRYKDQYRQLKQEMRDSYRQQSSRSITESEVEQKINELRLEVPAYVPPEDDAEEDQLQKTWTDQPYTKAALHRKTDKESLLEENRKKRLIETVMIDQLSRPVISCPVQPSARPSSSYRHGVSRGSARSQHDTKFASQGTATENLLSRRVQFGARVISRVGRDALRELTGFYFAVDNSITVYEFKQFGKSSKALPFINRGVYSHQKGPRQGKPYTLADIKQGDCLLFESRGQSFPDSMKSSDLAVLKVTNVDDEAKASILFEGVPLGLQDEVWKKAHIPQTREEMDSRLLLITVQGAVRDQISKRGIKVFTGLCKQFHQADESGDGRLNRVELEKALIDYHIDIPQEHFDDLYELLDSDNSSFLEYDEFMRGFLGEMSENRKALVLIAFRKIDPAKNGEVTMDSMKKFYNAHKHPRVRSGECTEAEVFSNFLSHFSHTATPNVVTFFEFENYYEGLSVCVEDDEDFAKILQNAWSI